jgi:putative ABC transport system permease protein
VAQPPTMLTTLRGLRAFVDPDAYEGANDDAPISVIRVRLEGTIGSDDLSRERIRSVAQAIHERTGLAVDITAGSSPHPLMIDLSAGEYGRPQLTVREGWVEKGVAVEFVDAIDRKSLALFGLIVVICGFFLANGTLASVRTRRIEIGTLLCLGWSQGNVFRAVLGEVVLVGLIAGVLGTGIAAAMVPVLSLTMPLVRTLLVVPVALGLAIAAGVLPAWRAARSVPMDAVRPAVAERGRRGHTRSVRGMAWANLRRVPSRTLLGSAGLFVGIAALTVLIALNRSFQSVLVGTLLGKAISIQVRGVDLLSLAFTIVLGGVSVADVVFLNLRERAPELVTLRSVGWRERDLRAVVVTEGAVMGAMGSLAGAGVGVGLSALVQGVDPGSMVLAASIGTAAGVLASIVASLGPLAAVGRLTPTTVLAAEG